ncbi:MAG: class I SAM-dependent methyltransferase [Nostoc sp.]
MFDKIRQIVKAIWNLLRFFKKNYNVAYKSQEVLNTVRTTNNQQPNLTFLNERLLFTADAIRFNIKTLGYEYARSLREQLAIPSNLSPQKINLQSKACQQNDMESDWFFYWCQQIKIPVVYHRKLWEFCYILQALYEYDLLTPGRKGLGFGCGEEPLPSILAAYDIAITATDLDPTASAAQGWIETKQNMSSLEKIFRPELCTKELFTKNVSLKYVDMNAIPAYLEGKYDFCWSACALEHLGSIQNGLLFIENSLKTLVPGGISIQTTEFNYLEEEETIDNYGTVLFRKKDFEEIAQKLIAAGHQVAPLDFNIGSRVLDRFIDLPPYNSKVHELAQEAHLKLLIDGFASTSFGMIIRKAV